MKKYKFTKDDLKTIFKKKVIKEAEEILISSTHDYRAPIHGLQYYNDEDKIFITAEVISMSYYRRYETSIELDVNKGKIGNAKVYCDCIATGICKHAAAITLKYLEVTSPAYIIRETEREVDRWISNLSNSYEEKSKRKIDYFFAFKILDYDDGHRLSGFKKRILKSGGISKSDTSVELEYIFRKGRPEYVSFEDFETVSLMYGLADEHQSLKSKIEGESGYIILQRLLKSEKLYYGETLDIPLKVGEKKRLQSHWEKNYYDKYELKFFDENIDLLKTTPPLYLDKERSVLGEVDLNGVDIELFNKILKTSPQIPEESIKAVSEKISRGVPFVAPLISEEDELIEFNSKPIINLFLGRKHFSNFSDESETEYMSLEFNYSGYTIFHSDNRQNITYSEAGKTYSITRDFDLEMFAKELILKEGFSEFDKYFISPLEPDLASSIERWRVFKDEIIPKLEKDGWIVFISKEFSYDFQEVESVDINIEDDNDWFSMEISVDIDGKKVSLLPMVTQFLTQVEDIHNLDDKINIPYQDGKFVRVSSQTMKPIIDTIVEIYDGKGDKLKVDAFEAHTIDLFGNTENMIITGSNRLQELSKKLKEFEEISEVPPPKELNAELRDYQKAGINWLNFLREFSFGGILADDMGLGKTIQTLAFLENERENGRLEKPVLVVAPTSLLGNWRREAEKFTPKLEVQIIHGNGRTKKIADMEKYHLNITTFGLIMRDFEKLKGHKFYYIIVDEAQKIKNFQAKTSQYLRQLSTENRIALTGTPMENHLGELWSIFTFLMPGFLGKLENFNKTFRKPIEKDGEDEVRERLKHRIAPFMLRRRKEEVVKELPPKNVIVQAVTLENKQAKLYETVRITMEEKVQRAIAEKGLASSHITILDALLKLRQVCCDPSLLKLEDNKVTESAKLDALSDLLEELVSEGRRILLFSQFTSMLEIIEERITKLGLSYTKLTGSTRDRDSVIEKFKSGEVNIFLISLKAGGVGLNLTEADTVIHYDPWWNPAVEEQATDRAYRIGQDKQVFVYKLIVENSVEEKILGLQEQKRKLTNAMIEDSQEKFQLSQDDIRELFAPIS